MPTTTAMAFEGPTPSASGRCGSCVQVGAPASVKRAALVAFGVAALAGLALAAVVGWELLVVEAAAIAAGWCYTGGRARAATTGSVSSSCSCSSVWWRQRGRPMSLVERLTGLSLVLPGAAVGALACALLVINNLRDIHDRCAAGKRTLAVRIGDGPTRRLYGALAALAFIGALAWRSGGVGPRPWRSEPYPLAVGPISRVLKGTQTAG